MLSKLALTAAALAATALAAPLSKRQVADVYNMYYGDGSVEQGWPADTAWGSFDELWNANYNTMQNSCVWNGWGINNSEQEIAAINSAIQTVSGETGVDNRFILAIVMQESVGCVRAPTTDNGVRNPGLMQSHNGDGTCAGAPAGGCSNEMILQMIRDGTAGTIHGDGLQQLLAETQGYLGGAGGNARAFYAAARKYNSGSVDYTNLNNGFTSTACYATDVANRFTGWTLAANQCQL